MVFEFWFVLLNQYILVLRCRPSRPSGYKYISYNDQRDKSISLLRAQLHCWERAQIYARLEVVHPIIQSEKNYCGKSARIFLVLCAQSLFRYCDPFIPM